MVLLPDCTSTLSGSSSSAGGWNQRSDQQEQGWRRPDTDLREVPGVERSSQVCTARQSWRDMCSGLVGPLGSWHPGPQAPLCLQAWMQRVGTSGLHILQQRAAGVMEEAQGTVLCGDRNGSSTGRRGASGQADSSGSERRSVKGAAGAGLLPPQEAEGGPGDSAPGLPPTLPVD